MALSVKEYTEFVESEESDQEVERPRRKNKKKKGPSQIARCYMCCGRLTFDDDTDPDEYIEWHVYNECNRGPRSESTSA